MKTSNNKTVDKNILTFPDRFNSAWEFCNQFLERNWKLLLFLVLLLAAAIRIVALFSLKQSVYWDFLLWDERLYHQWAVRILEGRFQGTEVFEFAPLPAYFIALVYWIFSIDVVLLRYINIFLNVFTCLVLYHIGKGLFSRNVGIISCLVATLYKPFILYSIVPLKTALAILLFALAVCFLISALQKQSLFRIFLTGVFLANLNNIRPNMLVLLPIIPLLIVWVFAGVPNRIRLILKTIACFSLGVLLVQTPFSFRNYQVSGKAAPITTSQLGFHLYTCNILKLEDLVRFASTVPSEKGIQFTIEASRRVGKKLTASEASAFWTRQFLANVINHPGTFIIKKAKMLLAVFNRLERGDHYQVDFLGQFVPFFRLPLLGLWLILPLGMAGFVVRWRYSRIVQALFFISLFYASTLILFFTSARMRLPLLVILIPMAVAGVGGFRELLLLRKLRISFFYSLVVFLFLILAFLPRDQGKYLPGDYNTHAVILSSLGREDEAVQYWQKSSDLAQRYSHFADLSLTRYYYRRGDTKRALSYLDRIGDDSIVAFQKYALLGDHYNLISQPEKAAAAYRKSLEINSGQINTRKKLADLYARFDPSKAKTEYQRLQYIKSFYNLY